MLDEYLTIRERIRTEIKVRSSRFIGTAVPVESKEMAEKTIKEIAKEFYDATHHCYAYRLGLDGNLFRYSDAGEPAGTAGKPLLAAIDSKHLTNLVVVIARYFGGTKLGIGGLTHAYFDAATAVLEKAIIISRIVYDRLTLTFRFELTNPVMRTVAAYEAKVLDTSYTDETTMCVAIRRSKTEAFKKHLTEMTRGGVRLMSAVPL